MVAGAWGRSEQHPLLRSIAALEVGDWATALWFGTRDLVNAVDPTLPLLAVVLRTTAGGMRDQAAGDVAAARRQYSDAARPLPAALSQPTAAGQRAAVLAPEPTGHWTGSDEYCTWRAARIIWREQTLITDLLQLLTEKPSPRDHLVEAYIQFQFEVEFSPYSWSRPHNGTGPIPPSPRPARTCADERPSCAGWSRPGPRTSVRASGRTSVVTAGYERRPRPGWPDDRWPPGPKAPAGPWLPCAGDGSGPGSMPGSGPGTWRTRRSPDQGRHDLDRRRALAPGVRSGIVGYRPRM